MNQTELAQGLADLMHLGTVSGIENSEMQQDEQGFSGAEVVRKKVFLDDQTHTTMIFKFTDRKERCAMQMLTKQKQACPVSYAADTDSDAPGWMAMEDLGQPSIRRDCGSGWLKKVADCLASIHAVNLEKGDDMPWLSVADEAYWKQVVTTLSVDHFEKKIVQNAEFAREFGGYLPTLRREGEKFAREMSLLSKEKDCMTLTHGDLQMRDGAHIYDCRGNPRIINFGFCRYAPFYIDLAGWFGSDDLKIYYDALTTRGVRLPYNDFEERARMARRYNGFIYLCPSVMDWQNGPSVKNGGRLLQALHIILKGDFPEKKRAYSQNLFSTILKEHQKQ